MDAYIQMDTIFIVFGQLLFLGLESRRFLSSREEGYHIGMCFLDARCFFFLSNQESHTFPVFELFIVETQIIGDSLSFEHYRSLAQLSGIRISQLSQHKSKEEQKNIADYACNKQTRIPGYLYETHYCSYKAL